MNTRQLLAAAALSFGALVATGFTTGCASKGPAVGSCSSDSDCPLPGTRCDNAKKQCVCARDEACPKGNFCNASGVCQTLQGCSTNLDCPDPRTYCNLATGDCLTGPAGELKSACGIETHCPYDTVCKNGQCVAGCFDDGDCLLGELCLDGQCSTGQGICSADPFCKYGERCDLSSAPGTCKADHRGPYCRGCTFRTVQNPEPCDAPRNFCLVNNLESGGHTQFCGVDCSLGQECPNGYACHGVVILTQDVCTFSAECRCDPATIHFATATCAVAAACDPRRPDGSPDTNARACTYAGHKDCNGGTEGGPASCIVTKGQTSGNCTCATNAECGEGGVCVDGVCCSGTVRDDRTCVGGENRTSGFCTCATDDDCPRDVCDGSRGACAISGLPCTPGQNDCGPIPCRDGGCLIGRNCAPIEGLSCSIVTGGG